MFIIKNLQKIEETIKKLRQKEPKITILFPNECKDSPILNFSLVKFNELYIFEFEIKENADLSALGKQSGYCHFEMFPDITYISYRSAILISVSIKNDNFEKLNKLFDVAEKLDKIDAEFISFIKQIINIEEQYRRDITNCDRFHDLIPDRSLEDSIKDSQTSGIKFQHQILEIILKSFNHALETKGPWQKPMINLYIKLFLTDDVANTLTEMNKYYGQYLDAINPTLTRENEISLKPNNTEIKPYFFSRLNKMEVDGAHLTDEAMTDFYNKIRSNK